MNVGPIDEISPLRQFLSLIPDPARRDEVMDWCVKMGLPEDDPVLPLMVASGMYVAMFREVPEQISESLKQMTAVHQSGVLKISQIMRSHASDLEESTQQLRAAVERTEKSIGQLLADSNQNAIDQSARIKSGFTKLQKTSTEIRETLAPVKKHSETLRGAATELNQSARKIETASRIHSIVLSIAAIALAVGAAVGWGYSWGRAWQMGWDAGYSRAGEAVQTKMFGSLRLAEFWSDVATNVCLPPHIRQENCTIGWQYLDMEE